jgi:serine/threonine-protein kinase RsbW
MAEIPNVCLSLPNRPENVLVVRQALTGVAERLALDAIEANDLNTAVSEACNNVVMHAYAGSEGPLEVGVYALAGTLVVVVRDRGIGIPPLRQDREEGYAGIGIPVINALSTDARFSDLAGGGTEVRMEFAAPNGASLAPLDGDAGGPDASSATQAETSSAVELRLAPNTLARAVLPRVMCALAARADFSTDRIADVRLLADVLAASARDSIDASHLDVGITVASRTLDLRVGPLRAGEGERLVGVGVDGVAPVIQRLTDNRRVAVGRGADSAAETLELRLLDRP